MEKRNFKDGKYNKQRRFDKEENHQKEQYNKEEKTYEDQVEGRHAKLPYREGFSQKI